MDNETILKLVNAGYTKEEIKALESAGNEGAGAAENGAGEGAGNDNASAGKIEGNAGEENAGKVKDAGQHVDVNAAITALTDTVAGLAATVKAMQDGNINKAAGGKATDKVKEVMDSFITKL